MPATRRADQSWSNSLTIDLFIKVLNNSIFHPFVASLIPLCLRAGEVPYSAPAFRNTVYWAIFVCILHILAPINERIAYGKPRKVDHEEEIVVITGGASGLGRCIAEIFALKGTTVVVLDVKSVSSQEEIEGVEHYQCDVGDPKTLEQTWARINAEIGLPTVLINNAGIVHGKKLLDLSPADVEKTFRVNTMAQYTLTSLFLRPLLNHPNGGTIVTISSVLAKLGAAHLSAYTASKAALLAYHASISAELSSHPNIKTILVTPGQLSTEMFSGLHQNALQRFFGPVVEVQDLAVKLVKMIGEGRSGVLSEPAYTRWIALLDVMPVGLSKLMRKAGGIDTAMSTFRPCPDASGMKVE